MHSWDLKNSRKKSGINGKKFRRTGRKNDTNVQRIKSSGNKRIHDSNIKNKV